MNKNGGQPERLSKLQKFILTTAYKKTIQGQQPDVIPDAFKLGNAICNKWYYNHLVTADILLNFYGLSEKFHYQNYILKTLYTDKEAANKARVATARAIMTLLKRGYITKVDRYNVIIGEMMCKYGKDHFIYWTPDAIQLTPKGIEKAAELLKVC